jgi:hypothetical protein
MGDACHEKTLGGKIHGSQFGVGLNEETLLVYRNLKQFKKPSIFVRENGGGENNKVRGKPQRPAQNMIRYRERKRPSFTRLEFGS